jgi:Ca-activated chloride channel homolog
MGFLLAILLLGFSAFAQNRAISGTITDDKGNPVPGAYIKVKGKSTATSADANGAFRMSAPPNAILVVSAVGYAPFQINIGDKLVVNIVLKAVSQNMQEVVVVGYAQKRKKDITASVSNIPPQGFYSSPSIQQGYYKKPAAHNGVKMGEALTGRTSGVNIHSQPGGQTRVTIRGISTINGNNTPLYIVNGTEVSANDFVNMNVDPNSITNVEVLKDATATAVYGSKATNGVIIVTLNNGAPGKTPIPPHHPEMDTEDYDPIIENRFLKVTDNALSTFSIDVDAASYSNVRRYLNSGQLPPSGAVRIEEMVNYFKYNYAQPKNNNPFAIHTEISDCPWNKDHQMVLIGLQGKKIDMENLPASNLVFLVDVSGSMGSQNKLPLVKASLKLLTEQLREEDHVSMVVYAGNAGLVLPPTDGSNKETILNAIDRLESGGSTAGGAGITLAYKTAKEHFIKGGNNRVILCSDGDFNVGVSSNAGLEELVEQERKSGVFLTVLGYGMGNYKDNKMQILADKGNGNHAYIDDINEAKKVLVNEFSGTLFTIAKDVKLQVEFNPAKVQGYRLIGYENRLLNKEDFNNDIKDAGDMGSGHTVTALYEIIPAGIKSSFLENVDSLKYQSNIAATPAAKGSNEIMTIKVRYKQPDGDKSALLVQPVIDNNTALNKTSDNFRFATAVAEFALLLRKSAFKGAASYDQMLNRARNAIGKDVEGYRNDFLKLATNAQLIAKGKKPQPVLEGEGEE